VFHGRIHCANCDIRIRIQAIVILLVVNLSTRSFTDSRRRRELLYLSLGASSLEREVEESALYLERLHILINMGSCMSCETDPPKDIRTPYGILGTEECRAAVAKRKQMLWNQKMEGFARGMQGYGTPPEYGTPPTPPGYGTPPGYEAPQRPPGFRSGQGQQGFGARDCNTSATRILGSLAASKGLPAIEMPIKELTPAPTVVVAVVSLLHVSQALQNLAENAQLK
jgi:hypothetical protein